MEGEEPTNPLDGYTAEQQVADAEVYSVVEKPVTATEVVTEAQPSFAEEAGASNDPEAVEDYSNDPVIKEYKRQINLHLKNMEGFVATRNNNLNLRTSGQISGVELDRLDAEVDRAFDYSRSEITRLNEGISNNIDFIKNESGLS